MTKPEPQTIQKYIATTRFNNETWNQNQDFIKKHNQTTKKPIKCIYPVSHINQHLPKNTVFYVLEMNNETNKIMGIGLVKNIPLCNKYNVYSNQKYNEYAYIGYHRIDRKDMNKLEETIMKVFDYYCFKGKSHLKRLKGIKIFPQKILDKCTPIMDLLEFITNIYKSSRKPTVSPDAPSLSKKPTIGTLKKSRNSRNSRKPTVSPDAPSLSKKPTIGTLKKSRKPTDS